MTDGIDKVRQSFEFQKNLVKEQKVAEEETKCKHEWEKYKQTIMAERTDRQNMNGMDYRRGNAYFIVQACKKCKEKRYLDMKVEA